MPTCALLASRPSGKQYLSHQPDRLGHAANWPVGDSDSQQPVFACRDGRSLPRYADQNVNLPDGLYLGLFNGRDAPFTTSLAPGFDGPLIGRLRDCHTVEAREMKLEFLDPFEGRMFFPDMEVVAGPGGHVPTGRIALPIQLGLSTGAIVFDGRYFADWTVFIISSIRTVIGRDLRSQQRM
ncbi:hypothetical protein [Burkholderia cenocepacia]|uniref:hypothetical protein n=1 Tax=Burkholderia cenocepacia TaxID=95486 RepID=UPI00285B05F1|nr:hypothetical protein [Burkholderia cenocepacia]MDR5647807.1 hypothetical protein [Burkholderia cenocepacia]